MLEELVDRFRSHDRAALARLLTLAARGEHLEQLEALAGKSHDVARVVAITGSTGVGKSSLIGKLAEFLRNQGKTMAVLACDPQSPVTGGALLGDRLRMPSRADDAGLYIRSLATPSGQQGVAKHIDLMVGLLAAYGFEVILLETTGAGQGDIRVRQSADVVVLLVQPESGDAIQWEKAGLAEVADVIVIHKADLPGAGRLAAELAEEAHLHATTGPKTVSVSSAKGEGLEELWRAVTQTPSRQDPSDQTLSAEMLMRHAQRLLAVRFDADSPQIVEIVARVNRKELSIDGGAAEVLTVMAAADDSNATQRQSTATGNAAGS